MGISMDANAEPKGMYLRCVLNEASFSYASIIDIFISIFQIGDFLT